MGGGFSQEVRAGVIERSNGWCEKCFAAPASDLHHRQPRGIGGAKGRRTDTANRASNCLALCRSCHEWVERNRSEAMEAGWLVSRHREPVEVPVSYVVGWRRRKVILEDDFSLTILH